MPTVPTALGQYVMLGQFMANIANENGLDDVLNRLDSVVPTTVDGVDHRALAAQQNVDECRAGWASVSSGPEHSSSGR